jgi:hypothetical protein
MSVSIADNSVRRSPQLVLQFGVMLLKRARQHVGQERDDQRTDNSRKRLLPGVHLLDHSLPKTLNCTALLS